MNIYVATPSPMNINKPEDGKIFPHHNHGGLWSNRSKSEDPPGQIAPIGAVNSRSLLYEKQSLNMSVYGVKG